MTDQHYDECIRRICAGDQDGLKQIYEAYLPYIFSLVLGILKNREDAEDVTSSFFIRIWNTAEQYKSGRGHKTYISTIARNMCIDYLRKRNREIPTDLSGGSEADENEMYQNAGTQSETVSPGITSVGHTDGFEDRLVESFTLQEALQTLKENEREIIHLKIAGELTFQEIADLLHIPLGTVTWRCREALKKLRRYGYE